MTRKSPAPLHRLLGLFAVTVVLTAQGCDRCGRIVDFTPSRLKHVPILCGECFAARLQEVSR